MNLHLQKEFEKFHEAIKLYENIENSELREKRDMLTSELRVYFDKKSETERTAKITFEIRNQGSYAMGTGVKPLDGDYDIDVMVLFNISIQEFPDPNVVKKWVYEALSRPNRTVEYKEPCVRVQYHKGAAPSFHVDLALYGRNNRNQTFIAKGKPGWENAKNKWEISNPEELKDKISKRFYNSEEAAQMRRVIRYLKRWKDFNFVDAGNGKPTGIAFTALAFHFFEPSVGAWWQDPKYINDVEALRKLVDRIHSEFRGWNNCGWNERTISVKLPVEPRNDLFERLSCLQQQNFKEKLSKLKSVLYNVEFDTNLFSTTKELRKQFGDDFPLITV